MSEKKYAASKPVRSVVGEDGALSPEKPVVGASSGSTSVSLDMASHAHISPVPARLFEGAEAFLALLLRQGARDSSVVARAYGGGAWSQFSGRDLMAHVGRSAENWLSVFPLPQPKGTRRSLLFLGRGGYSGFVATLGALCAGIDVMFMPTQAALADVRWCAEYFGCGALVTDVEEIAQHLGPIGLPVYDVGSTLWLAQDRFAEPEIFKLFRLHKADPDVRIAREHAGRTEITALLRRYAGARVGRMCFVSFGHDGFQKPEELAPDALVLAAQNFGIHLQAPASLPWKTLELLAPSNPFSHLSRFAALVKNGVVGFPNQAADWETNLRILRPTILFASRPELEQAVNFIEKVAEKPRFKSRAAAGGRIEQVRDLLSSSRALKLPEGVFDGAGRVLRFASRLAVGDPFLEEAVGSLRCVVHGLAPAQESHVRVLSRLGVPVVETYGVTAAAGLLSSNTFEAPHFNLIGSPLPHVSFRLGAQSLLEYKISLPAFAGAGDWQETGDVAQMTPFGFSITGRKKHLFTTAGGVTVSPVRLEQALAEGNLVESACIVGDRMPYLGALIVLSQEAQADFKKDSQSVRDKVQAAIDRVNETLPRHATIKKFVVLEKSFSDQDGEVLSSGALNRLKIYETRAALIENLYRVS